LDDIANYTCLFHVFCWAKYSKKFQVLSTSRGMSRMLSRGIMSRTEYNTLTSLSSSNGGPHNACLTWILVKCLTAMKDNTLPSDHALRDLLFHKMCGTCLAAIYSIRLGLYFVIDNSCTQHPFFCFNRSTWYFRRYRRSARWTHPIGIRTFRPGTCG